MSTAAIDLFGGSPLPFGGLSNEEELARQVPEVFRRAGNPWSELVNSIFFGGADTTSWSWKASDPETRKRQVACLRGALSGFGLSHEEKEAVCGWMLSEMLTEVPT